MSPQQQIEQINGLEALEELLKFRRDAVIENTDINTLFKVSFLDKRSWTPSCTIMKDLKIVFCGCGVGDLGFYAMLSTHEMGVKN